jgi:hypothetical protein
MGRRARRKSLARRHRPGVGRRKLRGMDLRSLRARFKKPPAKPASSPPRSPTDAVLRFLEGMDVPPPAALLWPCDLDWKCDVLGMRYSDDKLILCSGEHSSIKGYRLDRKARAARHGDDLGPSMLSMDSFDLFGHLLAVPAELTYRGIDRVRLYLPKGVRLTERHLSDVEVVMCRLQSSASKAARMDR